MVSSSLSRFGLAFVALTLSASPATAIKPRAGRLVNPLFFKAPDCANRPEFLSETRTELTGGLKALPKTVLVAREAEMWVEGRAENGSPVRVHAYQSFVQKKSRAQARILCGNTPEHFADRFSLVAPTLIDVSADRRVGNSLWQFQVIAAEQGLSVWNKKSPSLAKSEKLDALMKEMKTPYRVYQIGRNEYELVLQKDVGGVMQTLSLRYEVAR